MPVSHIPSAEGKKSQKASYRRRKDQNTEISELEAMLPWSQKGSGIDKISVLRLTTAYMKFKEFWQADHDSSNSGKAIGGSSFDKLFSEALDGFILVLSAAGNILYVSEGVADYIGITQQDVIGQSIYELADADDAATIENNLVPKGLRLQQYRQFYIRFKSSISPGKKPLSRFSGTIMVQVSGHLRLSRGYPDIKHSKVLGLVAECRLIEASCSILEIAIPQTTFTSTVTMDLKILSVDTKMKNITGFKLNDIEGAVVTDFFHPSDNRRSIHCLKLLLVTGESTSPIIRFMTHTGEWVWVQISGLVRYEADNRTPKYLEATFKVVCSDNDGGIKMIEQQERYGRVSNKTENGGIHADPRFDFPASPLANGSEKVVKSLEKTSVSPAVRDVVLHGREEMLSSIPLNMDRLAAWEQVVDAVVAYETSKGLEPNYKAPYPSPPKVNEKLLVKSPSSRVTSNSSSHTTNSPGSYASTSPSTLSSASSKPTSPDLPQPTPPNPVVPSTTPSNPLQYPQPSVSLHPTTVPQPQVNSTPMYPQAATTQTGTGAVYQPTYNGQSASLPQMIQPTNVSYQTPTNIPQPMATNVPQLMATNVPQPMATNIHVPQPMATNVPQPMATNVPQSMAHQPMITNVPQPGIQQVSNGGPMYNGPIMYNGTQVQQPTANPMFQSSNNMVSPQPITSPCMSSGSPANSPMYHSPDGRYNTSPGMFSPLQQQQPSPITVNVNVSVQTPHTANNNGYPVAVNQGNTSMGQYLPPNSGYAAPGMQYGGHTTCTHGIPNNTQYNNGHYNGAVYPINGCGLPMDKGQVMYNNFSRPGDNILETLQLI